MLEVRLDQIKKLKASRLPEFYREIMEYVDREFPDVAEAKTDIIYQWVEGSYLEAKSHGMTTKRDHIKYINYKCIFGDSFVEDNEFAREILSSEETASAKLADLKDAFLDRLRRP